MHGSVARIRRKEFAAIPCSEYRIISRLLIRVLNSILFLFPVHVQFFRGSFSK